MCGIAGIWNFSKRPVAPATIGLMCDLQRHRGPDDYGYAFFTTQGDCLWHGKDLGTYQPSGELALGHRRLAIIDLSEAAAQPMTTEKGRFWITYNGEIYNYIELREELKKLGHTFATSSDTEVVLKAYQQWDTSCVEHFNGMWAFAIWDVASKRLFCSRDRVGIKPFYYYLDDQRFIFASEIKAVLAALEPEQPSINEPYLARFILYGLLNDGEDTLFTQVRQLLPGHCLELHQGKSRRWRYWDIPAACIEQADSAIVDENEAAEQFRDLLTDAIHLRFRADVPVGTCLSGGLDSSTIVALAHRILPGKLSTFTTEYHEQDFSEGRFARATAEMFDTDAHYITPAAEQYIDFIDRFSWYHDEPCPGPGPFSQWQVMALAGKHVKVALDGQGADELLAGYTHYFDYYLRSLLRRTIITGPARTTFSQYFAHQRTIRQHQGITPALSYSAALTDAARILLPDRWRRLLRPLANTLRQNSIPMNKIAPAAFVRQALPVVRPRPRRYQDELNEILYWELTRDNIPMLLQYEDRTSMAFSIESRLPFLDYRLIEFAGSLPYHLKIRSATTKYILRRSMRRLLPDEIIDRTDKMGFPTPFALWLKGPLNQYLRDLLADKAFSDHGIFEPTQVKELLDQHCTGRADHAWLLWRVVNIERWMRVFLDDFSSSCRRMGQFLPLT